jgi:hypothetical protein
MTFNVNDQVVALPQLFSKDDPYHELICQLITPGQVYTVGKTMPWGIQLVGLGRWYFSPEGWRLHMSGFHLDAI